MAENTKKITWTKVLLIIGTIFTVFAIVALWLNNALINTEGYVSTVAPLSQNQAIATDISSQLTEKIFNQIPVEETIKNALPSQAQFLSQPLTAEFENFIQKQLQTIITSPQFNQIWIQINRLAHDQVIKLLTGSSEIVTVNQDQVVLNLQPLIEALQTNLSQKGINIFSNLSLPNENRQFVLFQSQTIVKAQKFVNAIDKLSFIFPAVALIAFVGAIILLPNHFRAVFWVGICLAIDGVITLILLVIGRSQFIKSTPNLSDPASTAFYDTITRLLQNTAWTILGLGILLAIIFYFLKKRQPETSS